MNNNRVSSEEKISPSVRISSAAHVRSMDQYLKMYERSIKDNTAFWSEMGKSLVTWFQPFDQVMHGGFNPDPKATQTSVSWFLNGKLNASYNCLDRHAISRPDDIAIIWEGNEPGDVKKISYKEALEQVCKIANAMKAAGIRKGDTVCIYMPMVPEAAYAMLACTRIGAVHNVVFAGFSAESLRDRIRDSNCVAVFTADEGLRGAKTIPLKPVVDEALKSCPSVKTVFVHKRTGGKVTMEENRDLWLHTEMEQSRAYCPPEVMDSEDVLFMLYTSGSTGKPKGIAHTTGGYLTYAALTHKMVFDYKPGDIYACVADIGWVTGHSYIVYGPLMNGATTFMFESLPNYPTPARYWDMVERHKINILYTAPTAIRALMTTGEQWAAKHDLSSLRVLGSVGEPINPEAWKWYFEVAGRKNCSIVDTYWQTETGGVVMTPLPGATTMKPGACSRPFFGVEPVLVDEKGKELEGNNVTGMLAFKRPWPGMARTIFKDHKRWHTGYFAMYPGLYFTGDNAKRDADGDYWVIGRADDVMNVAGHRIGSAEVESALVEYKHAAEAAVVGIPHDVKGESLVAYVTLKQGAGPNTNNVHLEALKSEVRKQIGGLAVPDMIVITPGLPKTRSGKIMRRLLRKVAQLQVNDLGDTSTLADPSVVEALINAVKELKQGKSKL